MLSLVNLKQLKMLSLVNLKRLKNFIISNSYNSQKDKKDVTVIFYLLCVSVHLHVTKTKLIFVLNSVASKQLHKYIHTVLVYKQKYAVLD